MKSVYISDLNSFFNKVLHYTIIYLTTYQQKYMNEKVRIIEEFFTLKTNLK